MFNAPKPLTALGLVLNVCLFSSAQAQIADAASIPEYEINRNTVELNDQLRPRPDIDVFDTALLFTSYDNNSQVVYCKAFNARGKAIGRTRTHLPADSVRLIFASDVARQPDFVGKINCQSRGQMMGSVYLLGPVFNDLAVTNKRDRAGSTVQVPVALNR